MSYRKEKIEEMIRRIVAEMMLKEIKDPRIGFASITGVELSSDKKHAKIGISVLGNARERQKTLDGLKSATGFIQHRLGKELRIRYTPAVHFFLDSSVAEGITMVSYLEGLVHRDDENKPKEEKEKDADIPKDQGE